MGTIEGGCHCGNLRFALATAFTPASLPLRACQCSFCRAHGAVSTSDPAGRVQLAIRDPARVIRYRFGLQLADFLVCGGCGVYVGAQMAEGPDCWMVLNANTLDAVDAVRDRAAEPMDYDGEDASGRIARRKARWTPVAQAAAIPPE